jgi:hypothetical protein
MKQAGRNGDHSARPAADTIKDHVDCLASSCSGELREWPSGRELTRDGLLGGRLAQRSSWSILSG